MATLFQTSTNKPSTVEVPPPPLKERLANYPLPFFLILLFVQGWFLTIYSLLLKGDFETLFNFEKLRRKSFARMWAKYGDALSTEMALDTFDLIGSVKGTVLDLGPGNGSMVKHFSPSQITVVYGIEPATDLHSPLLAAAEKRGFDGKYKAVPAGAEPESLLPALARACVIGEGKTEVFDEIVCIRVLCSVPQPEEVTKGLYRLLKPGGRLVVAEHVVNPWHVKQGSIVGRALQIVYHLLGWQFWAGGCCLDRDTETILRNAGTWSKVSLQRANSWSVIPQIVGYLIKA